MKFIRVEMSLPGAEKPLVLGAVFDRSGWLDRARDSEVLNGWMADNLERNAGALDLLCSDGFRRRIGAALLAQAIVQYQIVDMPALEMPAPEMPAPEMPAPEMPGEDI